MVTDTARRANQAFSSAVNGFTSWFTPLMWSAGPVFKASRAAAERILVPCLQGRYFGLSFYQPPCNLACGLRRLRTQRRTAAPSGWDKAHRPDRRSAFCRTYYRVALADGIMDRVNFQDLPEDAS